VPDIPATTPLIDPEPLLTLAEAARLTQRPLRLIQAWTNAGPNGEAPILPVARQDATGLRRKWVRLDAVRAATTSRRHWGTKRTKRRQLTTEGGRTLEITGQRGTPSRLDK
jgi:hypothetical protein